MLMLFIMLMPGGIHAILRGLIERCAPRNRRVRQTVQRPEGTGGCRVCSRYGQHPRADRTERRRQDDAAEPAYPHLPADRRPHRLRRAGSASPCATRGDHARARPHLPAHGIVPRVECAGERAGRRPFVRSRWITGLIAGFPQGALRAAGVGRSVARGAGFRRPAAAGRAVGGNAHRRAGAAARACALADWSAADAAARRARRRPQLAGARRGGGAGATSATSKASRFWPSSTT